MCIRDRSYRHGGKEEPAAGLPGSREGAAEGPVPLEGAAGLGLRAGDRHPQARETEPRAAADRAVPLLLGLRIDQVERDDLLRDPDGAAENRTGSGRAGSAPAREPRYRAGAE